MNEWKELKQALPVNDGWVKCGPRYVDADAVRAINEGGSMKADEIRQIADASNRGLREISRKFSAQEVQAEAVIHAAQWLVEIAAQLAEMNERAEKLDTFVFGGRVIARDAVTAVGLVSESSNGHAYYTVRLCGDGGEGLTFDADFNPRHEFIKAWKGE